MRRWNGWGDESVTYPLGAGASRFLESKIGAGTRPRDATLSDVLKQVPASRLPAHPLVSTAAADRARHARGQSFPDWVALRSGRIGAFPDGVAFPEREADVRELLRYAASVGARVIPYGGGTSVVGHINPLTGGPPTLTINMSRLNRLIRFDPESGLATFGAGVAGPDLEAQLRAHGWTLGHFPQSFELSTLGGWIASRSSGQQSLFYGRIERLFAGGRVETPAGTLDLIPYPASAAGPDVREMVLGSEGRMGIITEATVRAVPLPEREAFRGVFFPDFERGMDAVRQMVQSGIPASMLRLSTAIETETTLALAGHERLIGLLERALAVRRIGADKCMLILGVTGRKAIAGAALKEAQIIARLQGGVRVGAIFGRQWLKSRFRTPYLRNTLWEMGYGVDTLETAVPWAAVPATIRDIESALRDTLAEYGERVYVFTHLSHVYPHGSSVYTTYAFRLAADPEETLRRWRLMKDAASRAVVANQGTISHQHGVGTDHAPYLPAEKGPLGMAAIADVCRRFDPEGIMNPGKLFTAERTDA